VIINCLLYAAAGFFMEVLITSYHRSVIAERNLMASLLATTITTVGLLVVTGIIKEILDPAGDRAASVSYVFIYAIAKGIGAYCSLSWWTKRAECQRRAH
jgi:hypothetical protein